MNKTVPPQPVAVLRLRQHPGSLKKTALCGNRCQCSLIPTLTITLESQPSSQRLDMTNTLVLTGLTQEFFRLDVLDELRNVFALYGEINQWVKLSTLGRIIIVYLSEEDAMRAKICCIEVIRQVFCEVSNIGLYAAEPNPLRFGSELPDTSYLRVPALEKNFLISPPGSPPAGWEPVKEDPPNVTPLADDIISALKQLQLRRSWSGVEMVLDPDEGSGIGICVEDYDGEDQDNHVKTEWNYGEREPSRIQWQATALPPLGPCIS